MKNIWENFTFCEKSEVLEDTLNSIARELEVKTNNILTAKFLFDNNCEDYEDDEDVYKDFDHIYSFDVRAKDLANFGHVLFHVCESLECKKIRIYTSLIGIEDVELNSLTENNIRTVIGDYVTNNIIEQKITRLYQQAIERRNER